MKHNFLKTFGILLISSIIVYSCSKDTPAPAYVGTWAATVTYKDTSSNQNYAVRYLFTFTESSFTKIFQEISSTNNQWVNELATKGDLSVSGNKITYNVTDIGISSVNPGNNQPTGVITYYNENSSALEFQTYLSTLEAYTDFSLIAESKTYTNTFTISGKFLSFSEYPNAIFAKQ